MLPVDAAMFGMWPPEDEGASLSSLRNGGSNKGGEQRVWAPRGGSSNQVAAEGMAEIRRFTPIQIVPTDLSRGASFSPELVAC